MTHFSKSLTVILLGISFVIMSGCASTPTVISVTYYSDPPGAMFYSGGRFIGVTPLTITYPQNINFLNGGCQLGENSLIRWGSGAEASLSSIRLCKNVGYNQQFTFQRPANVPGREVDMQFAIELQRNAILQQQAQAQRDAALIQAWGAMNAAIQQNKGVTCWSDVSGSSIYTRCK